MNHDILLVGSFVMIVTGFFYQQLPPQAAVGLGIMWIALAMEEKR